MQRPRTKIVDVLKLEPPRSQLRVKGWLRTVRDSKQVVFLELNDGSGTARSPHCSTGTKPGGTGRCMTSRANWPGCSRCGGSRPSMRS